MAENVALRMTSGTHASNSLSHGTFGTAIYEPASQSWSFLRGEDRRIEIADGDTNPIQQSDFVLLTEPEVIINASDLNSDDTLPEFPGSFHTGQLSSLSPYLEQEKLIENDINVGATSRISIGAASWLSADGIDSGNLTVPVTAYVAGYNKQELRIVCHGKKTLDHRLLENVEGAIQIAQILDGSVGTWSTNEAIEQVVFSQDYTNFSHGTSFAARHISGTTVFQPLLRKGNPAAPGSLIDPNMLLTIPIASTGGLQHSDVAFAPNDQDLLAIVDSQGNWSSWTVCGRRTKNARNTNQAQLLETGKLFSWDSRPRSANTELYFDGWHRVVWASGGHESTAKLLVCNRKDARVFDMDTGVSTSVDLHLDVRKHRACIVDAVAVPTSDLCFILTTQKILLYSFASPRWKSADSPFLVCAWPHGRSPEDLTLKLAVSQQSSELLLVVYSGHSPLLAFIKVRIFTHKADVKVKSHLPIELSIPRTSLSALSSLILARVEISGRSSDMQGCRDLYQVILQYEDSEISQILLSLMCSEDTTTRHSNFGIRLPPKRSVAHDSERYVNESEDEAGDLVFSGLQDARRVFMRSSMYVSSIRQISKTPKVTSRDLSTLLSSCALLKPRVESSGRLSLREALEDLEGHLENGVVTGKQHATLLTDLVTPNWEVTDIDADTAAVNLAVSHSSNTNEVWYTVDSGLLRSQLPDLYDSLFKTYIGRLPSEFPSRFRIARERLIRNISFEQRMSVWAMYEVQHVPEKVNPILDYSQSDSQILSDPLLPIDEEEGSTSRPMTAASQPGYRQNIQLRSPEKDTPQGKYSLLANALARLSSFVEVRKPPVSSDREIYQEMECILNHIPTDTKSNPNDYGWRAQELMNITRKEVNDEIDNTVTAKRKAKLARAQRKAKSILPRKQETVPLISSSTKGADLAALPIRAWTNASQGYEAGSISRLRLPDGSQLTGNAIMGDGLVEPENLSQDLNTTIGFSATQPVRGVFAQRPDPHEKGRARKRRRAGF